MTIFWLSFFHYYTKFSGFLAYALLFKRKLKFNFLDVFIAASILSLFLIQISQGRGLAVVLIDFRFWWGWLIFYLIFKNKEIPIKYLNGVLVFLCITILVETFLINTVIDPWYLPNFPAKEDAVGEYNSAINYQRPYAFGGSATVGSSLLVVLIALTRVKGWRLLLAVSCVFLFVSGAGILALGLLILFRYKRTFLAYSIPTVCILIGIFIVLPKFFSILEFEILRKVGFEYIKIIWHLKVESFFTFVSKLDGIEFVFGKAGLGRGGDFGGLLFFLNNGIWGVMIILLLTLTSINRVNAIPLLIIILTSAHYPVLFFLPGQLMFGLLLNVNKSWYEH